MALRFFLSGSLWLLGWQQEAWRELDKAALLIDELDHPPSTAAFMAFKCFFYYYPRDTTRMIETARKLMELSEDQGFLLWFPVAKMYLGWAVVKEGNIEEGLKQMESGLQLFRQTGTSLTLVGVMAMYAEILGRAGRVDEALCALEDGMTQARQRKERLLEPELYRIRGEIELGQGDESAAAADFDRALEIAHGQGARSLELRTMMSKCQLLRKQGKKEEARWDLQKIYDSFTEGFDSKELIDAENLLIDLRTP
jgi:tetratricopeptide (TPR) repeat protein